MIPSCLMWCLWRERNNQSYTSKYEFGSTSELVVSDGEDGDFWDEDREFSYPLLIFPLPLC
jgi:hypothetical protein